MSQISTPQAQLSGTAEVGHDLRVLVRDGHHGVGATTKVEWWCGERCVFSGLGQSALQYTLTDADDGVDIHAKLTWENGAKTVRAITPTLRVTTPAPRLRPLMLDDVMDQHTGMQPLPVAPVFEGRALHYSVLRGDANIDPNTGVLQVPTDATRSSGQIIVEGRNSGGAQEYRVQYTVEGDDTRAATSPTQRLDVDGVTFTFDRAVETGNFITGAMGAGDPFIVGPVTLLEYTPGPITINGRAMNGAMLNPPCAPTTGFDGLARGNAYQASQNAGLRMPLSLVPGDSLIVALSNRQATKSDDASGHFVILTCVAETPFADSFRPPYSGSERPMWRASDIDPGRLARLENAGRGNLPRKSTLISHFGRFALEIVPNWNRRYLNAEHHAPLYGRDLCGNESAPYVWANLNIPYADKADIVHGLIQRGIDRYGVFRSGREQGFHPWTPDGAHHAGRKFSIMFAGHLLGDDAMRHIIRQSRGSTGFDGTTPGSFHEDGTTFHVTSEMVNLSNSDAWNPPYKDNPERLKQPYSPAMVGMPDWRGFTAPGRVNAAWTGNLYRIAGNNNAQHGQVLAILAMGLKDAWGHDAYFDYHMRFMEIMSSRPDPWQFRGTEQALYNPVDGSRTASGFEDWQIFWRDEWSWRMLTHYRFDYYRYPWA